MKRTSNLLSCILCVLALCYCSTNKNIGTKYELIILTNKDTLHSYISNYFKLSEQRDVETWYNIYLNKCTKFYKIENPTKDSIINLIKSYWLTSDQQHHAITKIESKKLPAATEILVTMDYSYNLLSTSTFKLIEKLKLQMILDKDNKVLSIKELSRGI